MTEGRSGEGPAITGVAGGIVPVPDLYGLPAGQRDIDTITSLCTGHRWESGIDGLLAGLGRRLPHLSFRPVLTRGGWYRPGGVVDIDQRRIADSLRQWAEQLAADDDMQPLLDACLRGRLFATRLLGRTHYLTAVTGDGAAGFMQLEVEELHEVLDRYLSDPDWLPESLEEFIDPLDVPQLEPEPVGGSRLVFRRLVAMDGLLARLDDRRAVRLRRFLDDWDRTSAGRAAWFCSHWILAIRDYTDSDGMARSSVDPVPVLTVERLAEAPGGAQLANRLQSFDRAAGYPMAWFFHLLAGAGVSRDIALQVAADHTRGFSYLPARDLAVLHDWIADPYVL